MGGVRLFGRVYPSRPGKVEQIRVRVVARAVPVGAHVDITDLQLQPGKVITGFTRHPQDLGVQAVPGHQWRSGVIYGDCTVIIVADEATASPTRIEVTRAGGRIQIGDYHLGHTTTAVIDGINGTATQGAGIPPHLTARADIDIPVKAEGRAHLAVWFRGLTEVDPEPLPLDPDPIDPDEPWPDPEPEEPEEPPEPPPVDPEDPGDAEDEDP